ncbi:MAG: recombinase family protein [Elusimicrobia bacterium]|nr:recombinase family protein [Elusimicrobiota bacterium]
MDENKKIIKCAIYTRKSSEEGLELEFNSLQAQREACESYIKSQKHEGWHLIDKQYDDGGYSGGTLERPALKELLKDIGSGQVDIIVVYKIDRLTRSLHDFSRIVDVLDKQNTSFVSITQHFNTSTSMGRLTLNMLLSFAQFEREVTSERIRDKFAASKKKGMWMGGKPPMGYYRKDKKIYPSEYAARVRTIFNKYIELKSVAKVKDWLDNNGITSQNNKSLSAGNINSILLNRAFLGEVGHKGVWYKGEHEGIIEPEVFNNVQEIMAENRVERKKYSPEKSLLSGKIFDDKCNIMSPVRSSGTKGKKYRYYVSQAVIRHEKDKTGQITKISLPPIENFVDNWFAGNFTSKEHILSLIPEYKVSDQKSVLEKLHDMCISREMERILLHRIDLKESEIILTLYKEQILEFIKAIHEERETKELQTDDLKTKLTYAIKYKIGVIDNGSKVIVGSVYNKNKNKSLINIVLKSQRWNKELLRGAATVEDIVKKENVSARYVYRLLKISFLSPKITTAILEGNQPADLTIEKLEAIKIYDWKEQEKFLNI